MSDTKAIQQRHAAVAAMQNIITANTTWISFGWQCEECKAVNHLSWNSYEIYGNLQECVKCEKAHKVRVPFR